MKLALVTSMKDRDTQTNFQKKYISFNFLYGIKLLILMSFICLSSVFAQNDKAIALECKGNGASWIFIIENGDISISDSYSKDGKISASDYKLSDGFLSIDWSYTKFHYEKSEIKDDRYKFKINRFTGKFDVEIKWGNSPQSNYKGECRAFLNKDKKF